MGASDVVYVEKRRGPRTDPWGTLVTNWWSLDTSPPQATLKDLPVRYYSNQRSGIPVMSSHERVDRRIWWLTVSIAADRSSRMRTDDLESAFAVRRASVTESSAVSVEWPLLKPDCLASSLLFCERNNETWLKTTCLSVFAINGRREIGLYFSIREVFNVGFLSSGVTRACLNAVGKMPVRRDVLMMCVSAVRVKERLLGEGARGLCLEDML